jgi:adenine-specific DNA-methyltransferase
MIYIDPPYNTGNDFVYKDNFNQETNAFKEDSGQIDELNNRLVANSETSGRYHSDWLTMIYPRIKIARNLLQNDGVIYISIDDNEVHNLRKVCDEIFGEGNFRGMIIRATGTRMGSGNQNISSEVDYVLIYSKTDKFQFSPLAMESADLKIYDQEDEVGKYLLRSLRRTGGENRREDRPSMFYPVIAPDGSEILPLAPEGWESRWVCGKETYEKLKNDGQIEWKQVFKDGVGQWKVYQKHYIGEAVKFASNNWNDIDGNKKATKEVNGLFDQRKYFDHPKPINFIRRLIDISNIKNSGIILDFFSGSATTAHATIELNSHINRNLKYILVQLPELTDKNSEAYKAGYLNICEIGKERIRRAVIKATEGRKSNFDYGFRVYRLDESNMQDVYYRPQDYTQENLELFTDNVKSDRSADDLLTQIILDWGLPLSLKIEQLDVLGKQVFKVASNSLIACFDKGIDEEFAKQVATHSPLRIVFRDSSFKNDTAKENVRQLLKQLSPDTEMRVI